MEPIPPSGASRWPQARRRFLFWAVCTAVVATPMLFVARPPILDLAQQLHQIPLLQKQLGGGDPGLMVTWFGPNKLGYLPLGLAWLLGGTAWAPRLAAIFTVAIWIGAIHWLGTRLRRPAANLILASAFVLSAPFYAGFFNFMCGVVAFAFWLVDLDRPAATRRPADLLLSSLFGSLLLYWSHAIWFVVGLFVVVSLVLLREFSWRHALLRAAGIAPVLLLAATWSRWFSQTGWQSRLLTELSPWERLQSLEFIAIQLFGGVRHPVETLLALLVGAWIVGGLLVAWRRRGQGLDLRLLAIGAFFFALLLFLPGNVDDMGLFERRWGHLAGAFLVLAVPAPPVRPRLAQAVALTALLALGSTTLRAWQLYRQHEMSGFDESLAALPRDRSVVGLDLVRGSQFLRIGPFFQMHAYTALEKDARIDFSFTQHPSSLVVRRDPAWAPPWTPHLEAVPEWVCAADLAWFDYALLNATEVQRQHFLRSFPGVRAVAGQGRWHLIAIDREAMRALPPATRMFAPEVYRQADEQIRVRVVGKPRSSPPTPP
ncbi:MAG TPA: hypothetical protein PK570_01690 [Thermoanaerobaculia bacterium]|nr:hypothetical protein [Thermoanaerobaculia bacterium]